MTAPEPLFDEIYRETILDHFRRPRNRGTLPGTPFHAEGLNPTCGDEILLDLAAEDGRIRAMAFGGSGCSISQASASMLTERLTGATFDEADEVATEFRAMLLEHAEPGPLLGDLEALQGVARLPVRVKCALLSWNVLKDGLALARAASNPAM